jgi:hypothetical protein
VAAHFQSAPGAPADGAAHAGSANQRAQRQREALAARRNLQRVDKR